MATVNMQQTILNQVAGSEQQPQEDVELTELLPVKQSRIRENGIYKDVDADANATDALKVLRSFSTGDCNDDTEQEFQLQSFSFYGKVERQGKQGGKQPRGGKPRKGIDKGRAAVEDAGKRRIGDREFESDGIKRKRKGIVRKKTVVRAKSSKNKTIVVARKEELEERGKQPTTREGIERNAFGDEKEVLSDYEGEDEAMYLDLDRSKEFSDEIYVFRREPLDPSAILDPEQDRNASLENEDEIYENDYATTTDGVLFDRGDLPREGKTIDIDEGIDAKRVERNSESDIGSKVEEMLENLGKESSLSIEAIIGANYLLESENNNVVRSGRAKGRDMYASSLGLVDSSSNQSSSSSSSSSSSALMKEDVDGKRVANDKEESQQQKKYCCVVCEARFKGSGGLRNHYKIVHGAGPVFKCDECGKEFPLKERLKLHVRTHTGFKPYKCPECDKSFARGGQLVQHRRTHSQVKPYRCGLCSGTFTCAANLALHVKRHNGQKDHKCEICGRAFVRRDALKKHLECLHRDVKSFLCVICNKTFKGHLPQHMRTHARDRPHGCATCGQRFAQKSQLTVHQRTHSGQRPFRCLVCWQAFAHSTALKLHTRRHTGERPFKCAECNAGFTQLPHWKKHMKCIHGRNEPYACKKCKSFFRIKNDLECHEKTCHPELAGKLDGSKKPDAIPNEIAESNASLPPQPASKYRVMTVERMRLLLAVLLKRISKQERLDELGFGKRLIDEVLHDSLISAGKDPVASDGLSELESLTKNLEIFLKWTVPKEHWENFRRLNKSPEDILETLTAT